MKGGFDLDGVLAHLDRALLKAFQAEGRLLSATEADLVHYSFCQNFPEITEAELTAVFEAPGFMAGIEPCPCLMESAARLAGQGIDLHLVTARRRPTWAATATWVRRWEIPHVALAFVKAEEKAEYVRANELDFFVEDRLDTATAIAPHAVSFLVAHPHNALPPPVPTDRSARGAAGTVLRRERHQFVLLSQWLMIAPPGRTVRCE